MSGFSVKGSWHRFRRVAGSFLRAIALILVLLICCRFSPPLSFWFLFFCWGKGATQVQRTASHRSQRLFTWLRLIKITGRCDPPPHTATSPSFRRASHLSVFANSLQVLCAAVKVVKACNNKKNSPGDLRHARLHPLIRSIGLHLKAKWN